jgi:ribosomal protein S18 acetylase RimI-like enzyme
MIRQFCKDDYSFILQLWIKCDLLLKKSDELSELEKLLEINKDLFLVATEDEKIIGCVLGCWDGRRGWINHLAVDPEKRRLGIGKELMNELENRLRIKGCLKINLTIMPNNKKVKAFYKTVGYSEEKVIFLSKKIESRFP